MGFATSTTLIKVESGRIVFVPVQQEDSTLMSRFCLSEPIDPGKFWIYVRSCRHPRKVKKRRVLSIHMTKQDSPKPSSKVVAVSPFLFIGDATFLYVDRRKSEEYERAVHCCKNESSLVGAYRTNDGQVATGIRIGDKECNLQIEVVKDDGGNLVEATIIPEL